MNDQTAKVLTVAEPQGTALTPMELLIGAQRAGAPPELLEKYMALYERWEANEARKAFVEAFAAFKSEAIKVIRNKTVTDGPLKGKSYAELFSFVEAVTPHLSKHGLSASWNITRDDKDWIEVTCTIEHVLGHARRVPMGGPPDVGGAKNAIQARASTVTYLERHTLKAACGIAEQGDDADGRSSEPAVLITDEQATELSDLVLRSKTDITKFLTWARVESIPDIKAQFFDSCKQVLNDRLAMNTKPKGAAP